MSLGSAWPARAIIKGRPEALGRLKNGRIYNATPNKGSLICSPGKINDFLCKKLTLNKNWAGGQTRAGSVWGHPVCVQVVEQLTKSQFGNAREVDNVGHFLTEVVVTEHGKHHVASGNGVGGLKISAKLSKHVMAAFGQTEILAF